MNKFSGSLMAIEELQNGEIEIFPEKYEQQEYEEMYIKTKTKAELIRKMIAKEYSEFMMGFIIGHLVTQENQKITKRTWIPTIFKK